MVPGYQHAQHQPSNFPRIRGDGPNGVTMPVAPPPFSPYSRGWSAKQPTSGAKEVIFPVFAGMVPICTTMLSYRAHFPRIRGDGPLSLPASGTLRGFSPYSRGWSCWTRCVMSWFMIFPVFAGMVPSTPNMVPILAYFPRIRGDGPCPLMLPLSWLSFSPYSRGWS